MPDLHFKAIIQELTQIHEQNPDLRFGLVMQTAIDRLKKKSNTDASDIPSKEFLAAIKDFKQYTKTKKAQAKKPLKTIK